MAGQVSGQITVPTAGTEVQGPDLQVNGYVTLKAHPANTGYIYLGNDGAGAVSSATGYPLSAGGDVAIRHINNLLDIWVDSSVNGEKLCYLLLD